MFRPGIHTNLLAAIKIDGENVPKSKSSILIHHDEKSLRNRRKRDKGQRITNAEKMLIIGSEEGPMLPYRERKSYSGTTRGEILGPVIAQSWEESLANKFWG